MTKERMSGPVSTRWRIPYVVLRIALHGSSRYLANGDAWRHPVNRRRGFGIAPGSHSMEEQKPFHEFDASDFVNLALSPSPSTFGRLVLLADLRDHDTNPLAVELYGKAQIDAALERKHHEIFFAWLCLSRAAEMEEVADYLADQAGNQDATIAQLAHRWTQEKLYEKLKPTAASEPERELFSSGLRAILQLLQVELGSSGGKHVG
jgi:hypothetical protein